MYEALGLCNEGEGKNLIETAEWISNENGETLEQDSAWHSNRGSKWTSAVNDKGLVPSWESQETMGKAIKVNSGKTKAFQKLFDFLQF